MVARFVRRGDVGILFTTPPQTYTFGTGEEPVAGLTHSVELEFVDGSGVMQTLTATPGSGLSITLPLGSHLWLDATACRSVETNANTEGGAWRRLGNRFDFGEGLGTWALTGGDKNVVVGAPVAGYLYRNPGTYTIRHWIRDTAARQSLVSITVTVPALAAGVDIAVGGSWPTWASNTVYNLAAGTDHSAKGGWNWAGLHNVVLRKVGAGADPITGALSWHNVNISDSVQVRTRGCRIIDIDASSVNESSVGSLYCSVVGGPGIVYETGVGEYYWSNEATTNTARDNIKFTRGLALWDCGVVTSNSSNYVMIASMKNLTLRHVDFNKTTGDSGQHVFRGWFGGLDARESRFRSASGVSFMSFNKITGADNSTMDAWPSDDRVGMLTPSLRLVRPVCRKIVLQKNLYGASGSNNASGTNVEVMPENNDVDVDQAIELVAVEDNRWFAASPNGVDSGFSGRHYQYANNRWNDGAGVAVTFATDVRLNRTPAGWEGPYDNITRPVVIP